EFVGVVRRSAEYETSRTTRSAAEHRRFVFDLELSVRLLQTAGAVVKFVDLLFQITQALFENGAADDQIANEPRKFVKPAERYTDDRTRTPHLLRILFFGRFGVDSGLRFLNFFLGGR